MPLMNEISPVLRKTINSSPFVLHPQRYTVLQVQECSNPQPHFLVTHEAEEVTVITTEKQRSLLQSDILREQAWFQLIEFKMSTPFETPGFLAAIASRLASRHLNILLVLMIFFYRLVLVRQKAVSTDEVPLLLCQVRNEKD